MVLARTAEGHYSFFIELSIFPREERGPMDPAMMERACVLIARLRSLDYAFYHDGGLIVAERETSPGRISSDLCMLREIISKLERRPAWPSP
jgi:hypothetical protein